MERASASAPRSCDTSWYAPATFRANEILYLQFSFGPNTSFDVYVDDLSFY
jgi:hypothetical protein